MELYLGDCIEVLKKLPDGYVDLVLADPPYGTTKCKWDSVIPIDDLWSQLKRVKKDNAGIVMTASQPFTSTLVASNINDFKHEWIWEKNRGSNFAVLKYQPMKEHESVLVFCEKRVNYYPIKEERKGGGKSRSKYGYNPSNTGRREVMGGFEMKHANHNGNSELRYPSSVKKFNCEVGLHPTQKPVKLMEYLIQTYSKEGDVILDFSMGSGTTGVACKKLGREFIGIELDGKYFETAKKRIADTHDI